MENNNMAQEPKKKTVKDFIILFLAIGGLVVALLLLKFAMGALNII